VFVARVLSAGAEGDVVVEWRGARGPEVRGARRLQVADELRPGAIVALVFEDGDEDRAIVLGPLHGMGDAAGLAEGDRPQVRVAGRAIVLDAEDEVILRCGPATVHLKKDGTVAIRGAKLLSRASGVNRIKGGAVQIN
jgi:phage gp45-like